MSLSRALQKVSSRIVGKFGADVVVRYRTKGIYDLTTGSMGNASTQDVIVPGVLDNVDLQNVNELIQAGDKLLILASKDLPTPPTLTDAVLIKGILHQIIQVTTAEPQQEEITYELIIRA